MQWTSGQHVGYMHTGLKSIALLSKGTGIDFHF
jgi:hypothetical protein